MPKDPISKSDSQEIESTEAASSGHEQTDDDTEHLLEEHKDVEVIEEEAPKPSVEDALRDEIAETKDRLLRLAAEFENYKKITQREQQNALKFANEGLITNILPIVDSLEHAIAACKKSTESNDVLVGVEMVVKQLNDVLRKSGVEVFSALGKPFDPARHEAMGEQVDENAEVGTVIVEYQKGYLLHGRLLRPARVVIARRQG